MKLKTYLVYNFKNYSIEWKENCPVTYKGIEIGKISNVNFSKLDGIMEVEMKIYENNVERVKKLIGIKNDN